MSCAHGIGIVSPACHSGNWSAWWPAIREELIATQQAEGNWQDPAVGDVYGTAMALIVLQMPKRYLPIFQK